MKSFEELERYITGEMRMSHVYQPVVLRTLLNGDGAATLRQMAIALVASDEASVSAAEETLKAMPLGVLGQHGVVAYDRETRIASLNVKRLTLEQRATLLALCERRLGEYLASRGIGIWDYRAIDERAVPHSVRYQVLAESNRTCALCGASEKDERLHVDHIIPRSRGGSSDKSNLQVLCSRCNGGKGNRDMRDFRPERAIVREPSCVFCDKAAKAPDYGLTVFAVPDAFPVTDGHMLVIPKRHTPDFFSLSEVERGDADQLLRVLRNQKAADDRTIDGFNIGWNCGQSAGQTVMHAHAHLIPRRRGDVAHPAGGVRGVIPVKQDPAAIL